MMDTPRHQKGVTLIEVLVAIVIMAFGLIGIAALQTTAIANNVVSGEYTQAALLAQNMAERMRANREGVLANSYLLAADPGVPASPPVNCATTLCTPANQALWDLAAVYASTSPTLTVAKNATMASGMLGK